MDDQRKIVIPITGDASGVKQSFEEVKGAARDMAQSVQQAGQQAAKGVSSIGEGAAPAVQKVDRATSSLIGSIQRTTAAMEAGGKASSRYYELLAGQRGANVEVLRPYLAQLDEVNRKQGQANQALGAGTAALNAYGMSAKQMTFALRQVGPQVTDIVTGLASGQKPLTVLIQQGGQLKDVFGGIGPAARALSGYVVGLIGPFTIAAAAVAGLGYAMSKAEDQMRASAGLAVLFQATGRGAEFTRSNIESLRKELEQLPGVTKDFSQAIVTEFAKTRQIGTGIFRELAMSVADFAAATGTTAPQAAKALAAAFADPAKGAKDLDQALGILSASQVLAIEKLDRLGDRAGAQRILLDALKDSTRGLADQGMTPLARALDQLGNSWSRATDSLGNSSALRGANEALAKMLGYTSRLLDHIARLSNNGGVGGAIAGSITGGLEGLARGGLGGLIVGQVAGAVAGATPTGPKQTGGATGTWEDPGKALGDHIKDVLAATGSYKSAAGAMQELRDKATLLTGALKDLRAQGKGDSAEAKELADRLKGVNERIADAQKKDAPGASNVAAQRAAQRVAAEENARLQKQLDTLDFAGPTKLTAAETKVIEVEEQLREVMTGRERAMKLLELQEAKNAVSSEQRTVALNKQVDVTKKAVETIAQQAAAAGQQADAIRQQADAQEAANATFGKSKTAIEEMTLAQLKLQAAEADASDTFDPKYVAGLNEKVKAQERYVEALKKAEAQQLNQRITEGTRVSQEESSTLQLELSLVGQTQEARERIVAQRKVEVDLAKQVAEIDRSGASEADKEALRIQARAKARIDSENAASKATLDEWQRTSDSINQSLTDALLRGFESGKDFASNFRDTLKNMFSTLVLRPIIQAIVQPVSGYAGGLGQSLSGLIMGGGGAGGGGAGGLGGGLGNNLGLIGAGYQALTGASVGASAASLAYANGVGALGGDALGAMIAANGGWAGVSAGAAGAAGAGAGAAGAGAAAVGAEAAGAGAAAAGGAGAAAGATAAAVIPVVGWVIAAAALLYAAFGKKGGGPKVEGYYNPYNSDAYFSSNSGDVANAAQKAATGIQSQYDALVGTFGGQGGLQFGLGFSTDPRGTAQSMLHVGVAKGGQALTNLTRSGIGRDEKDLQAAIAEETSRAVLLGLQQSGITGKIGEYLASLGDIASISADKVAEAIGRIQKAGSERATLEQKLFDLTHTELEKAAAAREKERAAIDESNLALYDHVAALSDLTNQLASQRDQLLQAYQNESSQLEAVITRSTQYAKQLRQVRDGLLLSSDSPLTRTQRSSRASDIFGGTLTSAVAGNDDALQALGGSGQDYIAAVRQSARTPAELAAAIARVSAGLTTAAASADGRASVAQQQLDAMTQQLTALGLLNTTVLSVGAALAAYLQTQTAIQQENLNYTALLATQQTTATPPPVAPSDASNAASQPTPLSYREWVQKFGSQYSGSSEDIGDVWANAYQGYLSVFSTRGYAKGGYASGVVGVGELGPEVIDMQTPGRVYTNEQTRGMFASNAELLPAVQKLAAEIAAMRQEQRAGSVGTVGALEKLVTIEKKRENIGMPPVRETA